jgi:hypothetical protein
MASPSGAPTTNAPRALPLRRGVSSLRVKTLGVRAGGPPRASLDAGGRARSPRTQAGPKRLRLAQLQATVHVRGDVADGQGRRRTLLRDMRVHESAVLLHRRLEVGHGINARGHSWRGEGYWEMRWRMWWEVASSYRIAPPCLAACLAAGAARVVGRARSSDGGRSCSTSAIHPSRYSRATDVASDGGGIACSLPESGLSGVEQARMGR